MLEYGLSRSVWRLRSNRRGRGPSVLPHRLMGISDGGLQKSKRLSMKPLRRKAAHQSVKLLFVTGCSGRLGSCGPLRINRWESQPLPLHIWTLRSGVHFRW